MKTTLKKKLAMLALAALMAVGITSPTGIANASTYPDGRQAIANTTITVQKEGGGTGTIYQYEGFTALYGFGSGSVLYSTSTAPSGQQKGTIICNLSL